jgi:hypothetical protein
MLVVNEPVQDFEALVTDSRFVFAVGMVDQDTRIRDVPYSLNHKLTRLSFYSLSWALVSPLHVSHSITERSRTSSTRSRWENSHHHI